MCSGGHYSHVAAVSRWWVELSEGVRGGRCWRAQESVFGNSVYHISFPCIFYRALLFSNIFPLTYFQITEGVIKGVCCAACIARQPL